MPRIRIRLGLTCCCLLLKMRLRRLRKSYQADVGAHLQSSSDGITALMLTAIKGSVGVARLLLGAV